LRFWQGNPTVRLLEADEALNAMLIERCVPGTALRQLPESEQDVIIAALLRRLWHIPSAPHPFRPPCAMTAHWAGETTADKEKWPDAGLVKKGSPPLRTAFSTIAQRCLAGHRPACR